MNAELSIIKDMNESEHLHPETEMLFVIEGHMKVTIKSQTYVLDKEHFLVVNANVMHHTVSMPQTIVYKMHIPWKFLKKITHQDDIKVNNKKMPKKEVEERAKEMMELVGLAKRLENTYPHELDGGRRQRIGIARALSLNPDFIVCDEPVSALDVSIQAQILNLLQDLQDERGLTYMFITHDMSVVKHISDDIAVMYLGQLIEKCPASEIFKNTIHPYSQALLSAIPIPNVHIKKERMILKGELTSPIDPKPCCRFAARCPYATEECLAKEPELREIKPNHHVACHYAEKFV